MSEEITIKLTQMELDILIACIEPYDEHSKQEVSRIIQKICRQAKESYT